MKFWARIFSFMIFLLICAAGISTVSKLCDYSMLSLIRHKCKGAYFCEELKDSFEKEFGYWKAIYKAYHLMAYLEYNNGNINDTKAYIRKALHYHPYYPNGYKTLSFLLGKDTTQGRACYQIYKIIMFEGRKPGEHLLTLCLDIKGNS